MIRKTFGGVALVVAALMAAALPARAEVGPTQRLLVTFTSEGAIARTLARFGGMRVGPNGWAGDAPMAIARGLAGATAVRPDPKVYAQAIVNDPCVTSCVGKSQWYLNTINAPSAWDRSTGSGVTIAILDSGIDTSHPDLASKVTGSIDATTVKDAVGQHGTEVAGIAGAATNNGTGIASLGWNANLLSVKVLDNKGTGFTSWVVDGIDKAVDQGAKIVNLSLASTISEPFLQAAITRAYNRGVLVVAAAGNNDDQGGSPVSPKYPAAMDHVLSVAASTENDSIASFSRRGPTVDIAAPGNGLVTTQVGGGYAAASGTSLAAPMVSAAAALLIAQGYEASPDALSEQLIRSGVSINNGSGGVLRRLNAAVATQTTAPYGNGFPGGVTVAAGELDGDPAAREIVTGAGAGGGPHVRVFSANTNALPVGFYAYGAEFKGGVDVAVGDLVPGGGSEIVTAAGPGGGPHVRVFNADGTPAPGQAGSGFFAYGPTFTGGVSIAVGDVATDVPGDEIVTGAASNGGPHVRVFSADGTPLGGGFMAFDPGFSGGVQVAVANLDGVAGAEIVVAAGPGGGPHVRVFHGDGAALGGGFFAYDPNFHGGVEVAATADTIVTAPRIGGGPHVRGFTFGGTPRGGGVFAFSPNQTTGLTIAAVGGQFSVGTRGGPGLVRTLPLALLN